MDDPEIEKIKQRKLAEMLKKQQEPQVEGVIDLNSSNFDSTISQEKPTLVDFWAAWCGPCKLMHPVFERLSKKYKEMQFARVNVDENQPIAQKFGVQAIPTFILFKKGQQIDRMMGAVGEPGIHMIVKKHCS